MADYNSTFTGAQIDAGITKANTAVQSADLATVATTGDYADLSGKPTLGTAAATDATDYATAAQGALADSAIQSDTTGITGADAITNIVSLTQAEYDAIGTPSAATLYVVV
jgi:hypothetical protein